MDARSRPKSPQSSRPLVVTSTGVNVLEGASASSVVADGADVGVAVESVSAGEQATKSAMADVANRSCFQYAQKSK